MSGRWFRFYDDAVNDPKVQRLEPKLFKAWVNLLCLASKNDGWFPAIDDVAFSLRVSEEEAGQMVDGLISSGLVDEIDGRFCPHNWEGRQFVSDRSAERVQRYRDKRKASGLPSLGDYTKFQPALVARDGKRCVYCEATEKLVVDHMVPIALGGTDHEDNLALACKPCNSGKSGRTPELAGMVVRVTTAADALRRYRDGHGDVTVTITPQNRAEQIQSRAEQKDTREDALVAEFEAFWKIWPNKVGKPAALKSMRTARKRASIEIILDGARAYIRDKPPDRQWLNPATFLNQNRWEDQPAKVTANGTKTSPFDAAYDRVLEKLNAGFASGPPEERAGPTGGESHARLLAYRQRQ